MASTEHIKFLRNIDPEFLRRYDLVGPRYTSYPTAPEWTAEVDSAAVTRHLQAARAESVMQPLSIYMHLPFCIEHCTFCACNVIISSKREAVSEPYLDDLEREAELWAKNVDTARSVVQLHWGGGTPTYLNCEQLRRVHAMIARRFRIALGAEQSIEIHVSVTSDEQLHTLAELGFNRLSMGVQDFDARTQRAINRHQTFERTQEIVELARALGFKGINFDLVYGLPYQTETTFGETLERIVELRPDRLALYNFAFLPEKLAHQRAIEAEWLPGADEKLRIFMLAHERLGAAGYRHIGMDHFALPEDELAQALDAGTMQRNFMGFTTRAGADLIGMGVSAISSIGGMFAQNVKKLPAYARSVSDGEFATERGLMLSTDDLLRRDVIGTLMCNQRLDKCAIEARHDIAFDEYFANELEALQPMMTDGLMVDRGDALELTFLGRLLVRNVAMVFDAYLARSRERRMFSRTL